MAKQEDLCVEAKTEVFHVDTLNESWQKLIQQASRQEEADSVIPSVWGVRLECDERTAKRIVALAGEMITSFEALRIKALVDVLEAFDVAVPHMLLSEREMWWKLARNGEVWELKLRRKRDGSDVQ